MKINELLSDKSKWTQHAYARLPTGEPCASSHPDAVSWCLLGAVNRCYPADRGLENRHEIERRLRAAIQCQTLGTADLGDEHRPYLHRWNDHPLRTFDEVLELVEKAGV